MSVNSPPPSAPAISVVIPAHGRPQRLRVCLQALAGVDPPAGGFEVVVVDDGSPKPLDVAVSDLRAELPLTIFRQANAGPAAARNVGAQLAAGRLLVFTDDDCVPKLGWLRAIADAAARHPDALLGGETINGLPDNSFAEASHMLGEYLQVAESRQPAFFPSNNLAVPAESFRKIGGFDTRFSRAAGEDRDLCDRWVASGRPLRHVPGAVVVHNHDLGLRSFWRQHHNYGRGGYRFHRNRAERVGAGLRVAPVRFYQRLLARPLQEGVPRGATLVGLLALSQVANAAGFATEWLGSRQSTASLSMSDSPRARTRTRQERDSRRPGPTRRRIRAPVARRERE
jgi:GT2 family glycosyltransferase